VSKIGLWSKNAYQRVSEQKLVSDISEEVDDED